MNVIGDIAGNFLTLKALLDQMPKGEFISLGDMVDRGPRGKEVLDFIMNNKKAKALMGNHEHLFIDAFDAEKQIFHGSNKTTPYYRGDIWFSNGGLTTMDSFQPKFSEAWYTKKITEVVGQEYIDWLKQLPLYIETDKFLFTHAPKNPRIKLEESGDLGVGFFYSMYNDTKSDASLLWYRGTPAPIEGKIQIYGHNAYPEVVVHTKNNPSGVLYSEWDKANDPAFAFGIDTSRVNVLTGIHLPTMTVYQQKYID